MKLETLRKKIKDSGLRQNFIAEKMGISQSLFSQKINGVVGLKDAEEKKLLDIIK